MSRALVKRGWRYEAPGMKGAVFQDSGEAPPLEGLAGEIADVIGRERTLFLISQLPASGSRPWRVCVYVPKVANLGADHQLVRILGWHVARALCRAFGGEILQPSNCRWVERRARNVRIWALREAGYSAAEIAEALDITVYLVRMVLTGGRPADLGLYRGGVSADG